MNQQARRVSRAEREIARHEGRDDPELGELDQISGDGLGRRLGRSRRLQALFPGAARIARATGMNIGTVRGGMAMMPGIAGALSGSPMAALGGGATTGGALGTLGGLSGAALGAAGGAAAAVAAIGAAVAYGVSRGMANVGRRVQFERTSMGALGVAPSEVQHIASHRQRFNALIMANADLGSPMEFAEMASRMTGGGWTGNARHRAVVTEAMQLKASQMGITPEALDALEESRVSGGLRAQRALGGWSDKLEGPGETGTSLQAQFVGAGFRGAQVGRGITQFADLTTRAREMGTSINRDQFMGTVTDLQRAVGPAQAMRLATGMQQGVMDVATGGIGAAPTQMMGLMEMSAFGGLDLSKGTGLGPKQILQAQDQMARLGATKEGKDKLRQTFRSMAGGDEDLATLIAMDYHKKSGTPMDVSMASSYMRGGPADENIRANVVPDEEIKRELGALKSFKPGGMGRNLVPEAVRTEQMTEAADLTSAEKFTNFSTQLERAGSALGTMASNIEMIVNFLNNTATVANSAASQMSLMTK